MARRRTFRMVMSRRRKHALWATFFFFVLPFVVVLDRQFLRPMRQAIRTVAWASDDRKRYHRQVFEVVHIVDGDTLDIGVSDGLDPFTRVRLLGVDTPETHHPAIGQMYFGPEATEFTAGLADGQQVTVRLDTVADERDRYGRLLAYIVLPNEVVLNEEIVRSGYGYADLRFSHSRFDAYVQLMEAAIAERKGLWRDVKREQLPDWLRRRRPELLR